MLENFVQDLRYSWRTLWRTPGFTLVALATLALGIDANSSIFSVINAALLKDLPYSKPAIERAVVKEGGGPGPVSLANFLDWQAQSQSFSEMAAERQNHFNLGGAERGFTPERVQGSRNGSYSGKRLVSATLPDPSLGCSAAENWPQHHRQVASRRTCLAG